MPGPAPKPTNLRVLEGDLSKGKVPINKNEPHPVPVAPEPPGHLCRVAKKHWKELAPKLESLGLLTEIDGDAFAAYCQTYARWVAAETEYNREMSIGNKHNLDTLVKMTIGGNLIVNPLLSVINKCLEQMKRYLEQFGMTPAARTRIELPKDGKDDGWDKFTQPRKS